MADDATPTTTPADDGRAHVTKGTVNTGGRRAWVWCQDDVTGHRYDVLSTRLPKRGLTPVEGYPLNFKAFARPAKTRMQWEADERETKPDGAQDIAPVTERPAPADVVSGDEQHAAVTERPAPEPAGSGDEQTAAAVAPDKTAGQPAGATTTPKGRAAR